MSWLSRLVTPPLRPAVAAGSPLAAGARRHRSMLRPGPVIRHGLSLIATPPLLGPPAERHSWVAAAETLRGPLRSPTTIDAPSRGAPVQPLQPRTPTEPPADAPRPPASSPAATQATTRRRRSATADADQPRPLAGDRPAGTGRVRARTYPASRRTLLAAPRSGPPSRAGNGSRVGTDGIFTAVLDAGPPGIIRTSCHPGGADHRRIHHARRARAGRGVGTSTGRRRVGRPRTPDAPSPTVVGRASAAHRQGSARKLDDRAIHRSRRRHGRNPAATVATSRFCRRPPGWCRVEHRQLAPPPGRRESRSRSAGSRSARRRARPRHPPDASSPHATT